MLFYFICIFSQFSFYSLQPQAKELWERRQVYCQGKMKEEEYLKEKEIHKRKMSINRRESVYRKERRKSDGKNNNNNFILLQFYAMCQDQAVQLV